VATAAAARSAFEKKALHAQECDTEANGKRRAEFVEEICVSPPWPAVAAVRSGSDD
jgi:hypothetical protein